MIIIQTYNQGVKVIPELVNEMAQGYSEIEKGTNGFLEVFYELSEGMTILYDSIDTLPLLRKM